MAKQRVSRSTQAGRISVELLIFDKELYGAVFQVQNNSDAYPREWKAFCRHLDNSQYIKLAAMHDYQVVGFMLFEERKFDVVLHDLIVDYYAQRLSVGTQMIRYLQDRFCFSCRETIQIMVPEHNVDAQLFLKKMGFLSNRNKTEKNAYKMHDGNYEDGYLFEYRK